MKYAIVYSSATGNTAMLANKIKEELGEAECTYMGKASEEAMLADILYIGFWTDKGSCPDEIADFLKQLHHKHVFLFGTAGFKGEQSYFDRILCNVQKNLPPDNTVVDSYMCQGKMPIIVRQRYEGMLAQNDKMQAMIDNFDTALQHPNMQDIQALKEKLKIVVQQ